MSEYPPSGPPGEQNVPPAGPPQHGQQPPPYGTPPQYGAPPPYGQQPPQYGAPQYGAPGGVAGVTDADRRTWGMLSHLGGIILGVIAPLIVWAMYKDRDEFLKDQSTEALNFQITVLFALVGSWILTVVTFGILSFLPLLVFVGNAVFCIIGGMAANRGEGYRYPVAVRLVK